MIIPSVDHDQTPRLYATALLVQIAKMLRSHPNLRAGRKDTIIIGTIEPSLFRASKDLREPSTRVLLI